MSSWGDKLPSARRPSVDGLSLRGREALAGAASGAGRARLARRGDGGPARWPPGLYQSSGAWSRSVPSNQKVTASAPQRMEGEGSRPARTRIQTFSKDRRSHRPF